MSLSANRIHRWRGSEKQNAKLKLKITQGKKMVSITKKKSKVILNKTVSRHRAPDIEFTLRNPVGFQTVAVSTCRIR